MNNLTFEEEHTTKPRILFCQCEIYECCPVCNLKAFKENQERLNKNYEKPRLLRIN